MKFEVILTLRHKKENRAYAYSSVYLAEKGVVLPWKIC